MKDQTIRICPTCGFRNENDLPYCEKCGAVFTQSTFSPMGELKEQMKSNKGDDGMRRWSLSKIITLIIVVILFFALCITIYSYISGGPKSNYYDEDRVNEIYQRWIEE